MYYSEVLSKKNDEQSTREKNYVLKMYAAMRINTAFLIVDNQYVYDEMTNITYENT